MIIGIAGNAGVGKDTCADHMVKNHGFVKVSLADPMKRICREVFDFSEDQLWGASEERNKEDLRYPRPAGLGTAQRTFREMRYLTPRHALQQLGTQWGRSCYENTWVDYALRVAKALLEKNYANGLVSYTGKYGLVRTMPSSPTYSFLSGGVVIPDVRFQNEVDAIREAGGKVWRVTRPIPRLEGAAGAHQSETELDRIDPRLFHAVINNKWDFETLYGSVDFCLGDNA